MHFSRKMIMVRPGTQVVFIAYVLVLLKLHIYTFRGDLGLDTLGCGEGEKELMEKEERKISIKERGRSPMRGKRTEL